MTKRNIIFIFVCLLSFCSFAFSQDNPVVADKVDEYDEKTETIEKFVEKTKLFLKKLSKAPQTTKGFIAIPTDDFPPYENLYKQAQNVLSKNDELKSRVELSKPIPAGYRPKKLPEKTEFWLIPSNAENPYPIEIGCGLPSSCPAVSIEGADYIYDKNKTQLFSAAGIDSPASAEIKYKWTVSAGEIVNGEWKVSGGKVVNNEDLSFIEVDFSGVDANEVTITLELEGFTDCQSKAVRKVKLVNNPK
jgi:hypothetical protein